MKEYDIEIRINNKCDTGDEIPNACDTSDNVCNKV